MNKSKDSDICPGHLGHEARLVRNEDDVQTLFGKTDIMLDLLHKIDKRTEALWAKMGGVFLGAGVIMGVVWKVFDKVSFSSILR